jgi:hypothetical protein
VLRSGLAAVSFDRFEPQFGGDGNTHWNARLAKPGCSLDSVRLAAQQKLSGHARERARGQAYAVGTLTRSY